MIEIIGCQLMDLIDSTIMVYQATTTVEKKKIIAKFMWIWIH